jgi:tyrocidine synthetase III
MTYKTHLRPCPYEAELTAAQQRQLLVEFNDTIVAYPPDLTVVDLFEEQVRRSPAAPALVSDGHAYTFSDLNARANQLAHYLREACQIGRDDFVDVAVDNSPWLIISLLGILKAGGAYLPIDPNYPRARIDYFLSESQARVHITTRERSPLFAGRTGQVIELDDPRLPVHTYNRDNPCKISRSPDLAYIIFTSGSTGRPKGILQTHRCLANFVQWQVNDSGIERGLRILQFAALSFDVSVQEILFSLISGGCLYLITNELRQDINLLGAFIAANGIQVIDVPFSVLNLLISCSDKIWQAAGLRHIISAGEPLLMTPKLKNLLKGRPELTLHNHYGPSETHMLASHSMTAETMAASPVAPVGKPVRNTQAYILDDHQQLVPVGVIGELYIGGAGVARGYLDPELTRQRFLPNPFQAGETFYKTGDLARWLPDGSIDLRGRTDDQVKVRGHRIELGEIEQALLSHPLVSEGVVVAERLKDDHKELIAYLVGEAGLTIGELRHFLSLTLPGFMIPNHFVRIERLPLSPNGKVDKRRLPTPYPQHRPAIDREPAKSQVEKRLRAIWERVLGFKQIGSDDNFFDLGGDSLKAVRLASAISGEMGLRLKVRDIFFNPTISQLAAVLADSGEAPLTRISAVSKQPHYDISNAQQRLLLHESSGGSRIIYNIPVCYHFKGRLEVTAFRRAFAVIVQRHEALRTRFSIVDGSPRQCIIQQEFELDVIDFRACESREHKVRSYVEDQATAPFDLEAGPLLRAALIRLSEFESVFALTIHHIISDAWSLDVFMRELKAVYTAYIAGQQFTLPALEIHYKDFSAWQQQTLLRGELNEHRDYWFEKLRPPVETLDLPIDRPRAWYSKRNGETVEFVIDERRAAGLNRIVQITDSTLFMVLLALVKVLLHKYTDQTDIITGSPISGRDHPDLEHQLGFYVNTVVLRDRVDGRMTFRELVGQVKQTALAAYDHHAYPFDLLVDELRVTPPVGRHPFFDVWVVLHERMYRQFDFDGRGLMATLMEVDLKISLFDLSFQFEQRRDHILGKLQFDSDLYDFDTIDLMKDRYLTLVDQTCRQPDQLVGSLSLDPE